MFIRSTVFAAPVLIGSLAASATAFAVDDLAALLAAEREAFGLPGMVAAVVKDGEIIAAGAAGSRAVGFDGAATVEDRIHHGSNGKAFTALLAAIFVEEGLLRWDSTVGEVLGEQVPGMNPDLAAIRLEQLLSHTSGIPTDTPEMLDIYFSADAFDSNPATQRLMALDAWKGNIPSVPDGSPFQYSNFGYIIAGTMIEAVGGRPWEMLVLERIFDPLGLESAGIGGALTPGRIDAMAGHLIDGDGNVAPRLWGPGAGLPPVLWPAGGAYMSILDYARWAGWVAGGARRGPALVQPETLAYLMTEKVQTPPRPDPPPGTPAEGGYALGWGLIAFDWADRVLATHNGSNGRNLSKILVDSDADLAVVVAVNLGGPDAETAAGEVMKQLYEAYR